jgi:hypothetical protein
MRSPLTNIFNAADIAVANMRVYYAENTIALMAMPKTPLRDIIEATQSIARENVDMNVGFEFHNVNFRVGPNDDLREVTKAALRRMNESNIKPLHIDAKRDTDGAYKATVLPASASMPTHEIILDAIRFSMSRDDVPVYLDLRGRNGKPMPVMLAVDGSSDPDEIERKLPPSFVRKDPARAVDPTTMDWDKQTLWVYGRYRHTP